MGWCALQAGHILWYFLSPFGHKHVLYGSFYTPWSMPSTKGTIWWVSVWSIHMTRFRFRYIVLMWLSGHGPHLWRSPGRRLIQEWFRFTFSSLWPAPTWFSSEGNSAFHSRDSQTPKLHIRLSFAASFGNPFLKTPQFLGPWLKKVLPFLLFGCCNFFLRSLCILCI